MHVLITGSSGQIGTNLALHLLKEGHRIFGVDKRLNSWTNDIPCILQDLSGKYSNFVGGIGDVIYPKDIDLVVHFAANAKVHELVQHPDRAMDNIQITFNVLEFCRQNNLPIIFSSSREVYGDIHRYLTNEEHSDFHFTESPYSASKISGEALIYSYARCYGLKYIVFRFSNVYGRFDSDIERMERVIPLFIQRIYNDQAITIFGKDKRLDFTYIDDCVQGVALGIKKLLSGEVVNQTINLAKGEGYSLIEMATFIWDTFRKAPKMTVEASKKTGEVVHYIADIKKAVDLLGYHPEVELQDGIRYAIAWWKEYYGLEKTVKFEIKNKYNKEINL